MDWDEEMEKKWNTEENRQVLLDVTGLIFFGLFMVWLVLVTS